MISGEKIKGFLRAEGVEVRTYELIDSTNAEAKRYASVATKSHPVLFLAGEQSAGRGRMGRSFLSRAESGIYMSFLYFTDQPLADAVSVTTATASVTASAVERITGKKLRIKWVNDLYNERGKVCGILAETQSTERGLAVVVGIGINLGEDDFPEELRHIASSIGDVGGREAELVAVIADGLLAHAKDPTNREYMKEYRARFMLTGMHVDLLSGGERVGSGIVQGVEDDGGLLYLPDGEHEPISVHSGEVTVRLSQNS